MSSWGSSDFRVIPDNRGMYPLPVRDSDGVPHYRARVMPHSENEYKNLQNNVSVVTTRRGLGSYTFVFSVEAGPGEDTLNVPVRGDGIATFDAILVNCLPITYGGGQRTTKEGVVTWYYECDVDFIITSADLTPDVPVAVP